MERFSHSVVSKFDDKIPRHVNRFAPTPNYLSTVNPQSTRLDTLNKAWNKLTSNDGRDSIDANPTTDPLRICSSPFPRIVDGSDDAPSNTIDCSSQGSSSSSSSFLFIIFYSVFLLSMRVFHGNTVVRRTRGGNKASV